ncbi:unnamed protein product, partial [Porites evermanni]
STQRVQIVFGLFITFSIILRGYLAFASVKMPPKKKKRSCPFSSSKPRAKKKSKSEFDKEWAAKLAESDKGSFYQQEKWLEELDIQKSENAAVTESASCSKIQLEEPDETWKTISGRAIVSSEKLLEKLDESVSCRFCQGRVLVMENVATKHALGYTWRIQCENESCPSHKTNSVFNSSEKSRAFEINRASVLGLRAIGGRHSAASKFFSFLGLAPINKNAWKDHTKKIEEEAKLLLKKELNRASRGVKEWKFSNGQL